MLPEAEVQNRPCGRRGGRDIGRGQEEMKTKRSPPTPISLSHRRAREKSRETNFTIYTGRVLASSHRFREGIKEANHVTPKGPAYKFPLESLNTRPWLPWLSRLFQAPGTIRVKRDGVRTHTDLPGHNSSFEQEEGVGWGWFGMG